MKTITPKFVDSVPDDLDEGVLYISMEYGTVLHKCCCGCGSEVNTPLSPTSWSLKYDGERISLSPSIGNWSFPCQSHYWIKKSAVVWDRRYSNEEIKLNRLEDEELQKSICSSSENRGTFWSRLKKRFKRLR